MSLSCIDRRGRRHQTGVTLIEVLISMLLVALGTLAIVALQLSNKRNNLDAEQRALAAQIGYNFLEHIRANNSAVGLDGYLDAAALGFGGNKQSAATNCAAAGANCNDAQLAFYDADRFEQELDGVSELIGTAGVGGLINPVACLTANPPGGVSANYILTIVWRGTGAIPDDATVTCAQGTGNYGTADEYRRTLVLNAYVASR